MFQYLKTSLQLKLPGAPPLAPR